MFKILERLKNWAYSEDDKFISELKTTDYEVLTNDGFKPFSGIGKTKKFKVWNLETETGKTLQCADNHILINHLNQQIFTKDCTTDTKIQTKDGVEKIIKIQETNKSEHMYDLLDVENSLYLTNDILSHNSSTFAAFICWYVLFHEHKNVAILANKEKQAKELLNRIKVAYQNLPLWLQQGVESWNKTEFKLENGCKVMASSTSSDSIRGESISLLIVDECAFVPGTIWSEFWKSIYPTVASSKQSRVILISTSNGMNHFYKIWKGAINGTNEFHPNRVDWWEVPGYDEEWKKQTLRNSTDRDFSQEFENKFLASSNSLINSDALEGTEDREPIELHKTPIYSQIMSHNEYFERFIKIYKEPIEGHMYSMGVDPAKITEESQGDSLAVQITDVTQWPYENVFTTIIPDKIHYLEIPYFLDIIGKWYNEAMMYIENNDSVGQEVADTLLIDYEYENIYSEKAGISGFRTTKKNKKIGCLNLKMVMEENQLELYDTDTVSQLSTFIKKGVSYEAEAGYKDDAVMSLIASLYFMQDRMYFEDKMGLLMKMNLKQSLDKRTEKLMKGSDKTQDDYEPMPMISNNDDFDMDNESIF